MFTLPPTVPPKAGQSDGPLIAAIPAAPGRRDLAYLLADPASFADTMNLLIELSGLSGGKVAERLGISAQSINQYRCRRRVNPSLAWFLRFAQTCGARVYIEFPPENR